VYRLPKHRTNHGAKSSRGDKMKWRLKYQLPDADLEWDIDDGD